MFGPDFAFLPHAQLLTNEEFARVAAAFARAGVTKLRITGGEPLIREDLPELLERFRKIPGIRDLSLTTNGWFLAERASALVAAGLRRINVSVDALSDAIFRKMNGRGFPVARVLEGIEAARTAGLSVKINMVVQRGVNESEVLPMARHFRERGITLRFIEYMDVGNANGWQREHVVPAREILRLISTEYPLEPLDPNYRGEVATRYRYVGTDTEIGVISSISEPFCRDCHRARLSADGKIFTCLFASSGTDVKTPLRDGISDTELDTFIRDLWSGRRDRYSEERAENAEAAAQHRKVEMSYIGG